MQMISAEMATQLEQSSWIRRMFESGIELKQREGADKVQDFSLGNPDVPPPQGAAGVLRDLAETVGNPLSLGYIPNAGLPALRRHLAEVLGAEQQIGLTGDQVMVTCGAAGGLCALLRSLLEPGDDVVCPAPFFPEYRFYAAHFGGQVRTVDTLRPDFQLDVPALAAAIGPRTRVVLVNSPNNPTGALYPEGDLRALADAIETVNRDRARPVLLVSDEPYRQLVYDGLTVPPFLPLSRYAVVVGSFSKSLSLAGERIGYLALHPEMPQGAQLGAAIALNVRTLGYVNAPLIGQRLVDALLETPIDVGIYAQRREAMCAVLDAAGVTYSKPQGAFYVFPCAPGGDDVAFVNHLLAQRILAVPGRGFGAPGYLRLSYAVELSVIRAAEAGFRRAVETAGRA